MNVFHAVREKFSVVARTLNFDHAASSDIASLNESNIPSAHPQFRSLVCTSADEGT